jgi:hypothetical protein
MSEQKGQDQRGILGHFYRGLGESTRHNALAYGYSVALTGAFGMLAAVDRSPHVVDIFLFAIGAASTFTIANAALTKGFRVRVREEPPIVIVLGTAFGFASILGALAGTWLAASLLKGWLAWLIGPFVASSVYLVLTGAELLLARVLRDASGLEKLEEV